MGGHGGLNILPQKSWNVYGRDNREKVARDEAKHAEELEEEKRRKFQDDRDQRLKKLRDRARGTLEHAADTQAALSSAAAEEEEDIATGRPQVHINFWGDDEANTAPQDLKAEEAKIDEARRRGDPARQTSDARFDASFQLANGLQGAASNAWYVQPVGGSGGGSSKHQEAHALQQQQQHYLGGVAVTSSSAGAALALGDGVGKERNKKEKSHKADKERRHKKHKREKERERDSGSKRHKSSGGVAKKTIQELREARLRREVVERQRAAMAQIGRLL